MIKQSTILIAQPIAEKLIAEKKSLAKRAGGLIESLNSESWGPFPYLPEQAAVQIPEGTKANADHGWLLSEQSNGLSDAVNRCFSQITTYLKPFAKSLTNRIYEATDFDSDGVRVIYDSVNIQYSKLDDAFLNSILCPNELPTQAIDYSSIPLSGLKLPGELQGTTKEKWDEYLALKSGDYDYVFKEYSPWRFFLEFIQGNEWSDVFKTTSNTVDITSAGSGGSNLSALITGYFIFSRLKADDQPLEGLTGVDLATYRQYINRVHSYLTAGLVFAKRYYESLAPQGITIISSSLKKTKGGWLPNVELVTGNINIGITKAGLDKFSAKYPDYAISEIIIGKAYGTVFQDGAVGNLVNDAEKFNTLFQTYKSEIINAVGLHLKNILFGVVNSELNKFQAANPSVVEKLPVKNGALPYQILSSSLEEEVQAFCVDYVVSVERRKIPADRFILGSALITEFAYKLGMNLAGDILRFSTLKVVGEFSEVRKRELLTEAVVKALVVNLLK